MTRMADTGNLTPLAVVGMAFDFPQDTTSEESFWDLIVRGRTTSTEFPRERMNVNAFYHPDADRPSSVSIPLLQKLIRRKPLSRQVHKIWEY